MTRCGRSYEQAALDALKAVGLGVDEVLVAVEMLADERVPAVGVGELGGIDFRSTEKVNHLNITKDNTNLSYCPPPPKRAALEPTLDIIFSVGR